MLWIGTRKGLFSLRPRSAGALALSGRRCSHIILMWCRTREPRRLMLAAKTGHWADRLHLRSIRAALQEALTPTGFRKVGRAEPRAVERVFWLTPGTPPSQRLVCGSFRPGCSAPRTTVRIGSRSRNQRPPHDPKWRAGLRRPTANCCIGACRSARRRGTCTAISIGGVFESTDGGADWAPLNEGSPRIPAQSGCPLRSRSDC